MANSKIQFYTQTNKISKSNSLCIIFVIVIHLYISRIPIPLHDNHYKTMYFNHQIHLPKSPLTHSISPSIEIEIEMKEALVVCGDKNLTVGVTIWDIKTGEKIVRIPQCASPYNGITCLKNQYLIASQIQRSDSVANGVIFTWPFSMPSALKRSYSFEPVGPISSTKDDMYLAGGAASGNVYIWKVINGILLKTWHAHSSPLTCLAFSNDASFLISGSEDGMIVVWPMISLLDETDSRSPPISLSLSTDHISFITGLLPSSNISHSVFVSSCLDGTCKVRDLLKGTVLQTYTFPQPITAVVLDPAERFLYSGSADGRIFMTPFDVGLIESCVDSEDQKLALNGHEKSITALTWSRSGLISASEDRTACLWDVVKGVIIRRFQHQKGFITNMVVIPRSALVPLKSHQRKSTLLPVSLLQKHSQPNDPLKETFTLLLSPGEQQITHRYQSADLLDQQILDLEKKRTPEALELIVDMNVESRWLIIDMTKRVNEMNIHLQSRLLDLNERRISLEETETKGKKNLDD